MGVGKNIVGNFIHPCLSGFPALLGSIIPSASNPDPGSKSAKIRGNSPNYKNIIYFYFEYLTFA